MSPLRAASPFLLLAILASCAARTPGAQPHDMSVASHETTAAEETRIAGEHEGRYDPSAVQRRERCQHGGPAATGDLDACWTSVTNPTAEHLKHAEGYRTRAAAHRAASQALRDAEARACVGIPAADRDESPFDHREDVERVEPFYVSEGGKLQHRRLGGAVVTFRAMSGMSAPWLQRVVDCHLARNAALGHDVPEMAYCPLVPKGVTGTVTPTPTGFAVTVRSDDGAVAEDVWRRAQSLVGPSGH
jgi:hypothetical protein